ncbi:MAG: PAS domain-containing protein [Acidimicrobiales bacterium]|jgi:PAS domain S-box-containing protein
MRKSGISVDGFSLAAEFIPHAVWMATAERMIEYVNTCATDYAGLPARRLLEWGWIRFVHPSDLERVRLIRELVARTEAPIRTEFRVRRFDGQYRWFAISTRPLLDDHGRIQKWIGAAVDIHDQERNEAEIRLARGEAEEALVFLESLLVNPKVGLSLVDHDLRYLAVNASLAGFNSLPAAEHIGQRIDDVLPTLWSQIEPHYRRVLETGQPVLNVEVKGSSAAFLESFYPVAMHGEIKRIGAVVVREQKKTDRSAR